MNKLLEKITRKDLIYWIIILLYTIFIIVTEKIGGDSTVVNYISFAGTITSILLAVIAIIYSFFQNFSSTESTMSLINSAKVIEDVTNNLRNVGNIEEIVRSIEESVCSKLEITKNDIKYDVKSILASNFSKDTYIQEQTFPYSKEHFTKLLKKFKVGYSVIFYLALLLHDKNIDIDLDNFSEWAAEKNIIINDSNIAFGVIFAFLKCFSLFGAFETEFTESDYLRVKNFNSIAKEAFNEYLHELDKNNNIYKECMKIEDYLNNLKSNN